MSNAGPVGSGSNFYNEKIPNNPPPSTNPPPLPNKKKVGGTADSVFQQKTESASNSLYNSQEAQRTFQGVLKEFEAQQKGSEGNGKGAADTVKKSADRVLNNEETTKNQSDEGTSTQKDADRSLAWKFYKFLLKFMPKRFSKPISEYVVRDGRIEIKDIDAKLIGKLSDKVLDKQLGNLETDQLAQMKEAQFFQIGPKNLFLETGPEKTAYVINNLSEADAANNFLYGIAQYVADHPESKANFSELLETLDPSKKAVFREFLENEIIASKPINSVQIELLEGETEREARARLAEEKNRAVSERLKGIRISLINNKMDSLMNQFRIHTNDYQLIDRPLIFKLYEIDGNIVRKLYE